MKSISPGLMWPALLNAKANFTGVEAMDYVFPFEKLEVWKLSKAFATKIYKNTENFPNEEKFGLVSQLRRAGFQCDNLTEAIEIFFKWQYNNNEYIVKS